MYIGSFCIKVIKKVWSWFIGYYGLVLYRTVHSNFILLRLSSIKHLRIFKNLKLIPRLGYRRNV